MRLADWDTTTTAYYRSLWKTANEAHLVPEGFTYVLTPYGRVHLGQLEELLKQKADTGDRHAAEALELMQESSLPIKYGPARLAAKELKKREEAGLIPPFEGDVNDPKLRWRVLYALADLLSTQPPILPPERHLRKFVLAHCRKIDQELHISTRRGRRAGAVKSEGEQVRPRPTPPPFEQHLKLWKEFESIAKNFEKEYGPITRLEPFLKRLRAWKEPSEEQLMELWTDAVRLVEEEPDNPTPVKLLLHLDGERNRAESYRQFELPKRRGGTRTITAPGRSLKWLQRSLLQVLTHLFPRHKCAVGFERGESVVKHAKAHAGKRRVYVIDIQDFFPSITRSRVYGMLRAKPFEASEHVARYLANLVTHDGALPQGAPSSPILANLLCRRMDARLFKWARERGYTYSRYADDLAFSTNRAEFPEADRRRIVEIVEDEGFRVHPEKRKLMPWYGRQLVTGLVVNVKPNVPRAYIRNLRALLFNVKTFGWESQVGRASFAFDEGAWMMYKRRAISVDKFLEVKKHQREQRALVWPGATLPGVRTVKQLRRVIRGRIEFVGAVKGKDSQVYRNLLRCYEEVLPAAREAEQAVEQFESARVRGKSTYIPELAPALKSEKKTHHYRDLMQRLNNNDKNDNNIKKAVREWLEERTEESLECKWLLQQSSSLDNETLIKKAKRYARALDTHPHETAQFFREFKNYRSFRGLLHAPSEQDGERCIYPDEEGLPIGEIVGNCERAFKDRTLPNGLKTETERVIEACKDWLRLHPTEHPWSARDNELRKRLLGYVYLTRFQPKLLRAEGLKSKYDYEKGRPLDFFARLRPFVEKLKKGRADRVHLQKRGLRFHMYTPNLRKATELIIRNIVEKGFHAYVEMERVSDSRCPEVKIIVWSDGGPLHVRPDFDEILGGDSQGGLNYLRGYAHWTIEAPFLDEGCYQFDVMSAKSRPLAGSAGEDLPGIRHIITVYT
jgi:hypothetical protein